MNKLLCFGWIDGVIGRGDDERYTHRITLRKPASIWSNINVGQVLRFIRTNRTHPAGLNAVELRQRKRTGIYAYEARSRKPHLQDFPPTFARIFRADKKAWPQWLKQLPGYRRTTISWVVSAKQGSTRQSRLERFMRETSEAADSAVSKPPA